MKDVKVYEFLLKLNTYLRRTNLLTDKFAKQEIELGERILKAKHTVPQDVFDAVFVPIASLFEDRVKLMGEIREANDGFEDSLKEYYEYFRGILQ
jgi:hypothetical protein